MTHKINQHEKLSPTEVKVNSMLSQLLHLSKGFELGNFGGRTHTDEALGGNGSHE